MKKLLAEITACLLLVLFADIRLTSFYGVFGVYELGFIYSVIFTLFTMIVIINAFNLIDGINGLSGSISTGVALFFGLWFMLVGRLEMAIIALSLAGAMLAFLRYNITPAKIFMGDTGSLMAGAVMSILAISFIEQHNLLTDSPYAFASAPAVAFSLLILPLFDTLRVFILRVFNGKSPFKPDRNHIHHLLIDAGLTHSQAVSALLIFNVISCGLVFWNQSKGTFLIILVLVSWSFFLSFLLSRIVMEKKKIPA
jgi:UDP-N-acetylmuramyl pentapeptide phosphotransferase/UDP-N-acetylglucosamine-1-phosphate transferase